MALYPRIPFSTIINYRPDILAAFYWPADAPSGSKDDFISYFQLEYGEFTPIYQDPDLLKSHVTALSIALKPTLDKWAEALLIEYNPLENYDRIEDSKDVRTPDLTDTNNTAHGKATTITGGHKDAWPAHEVERKVAADNTSTYYEAEKTLEDAHDVTRSYQDERSAESGTTGVTDHLGGSDTNTRTSRTHGNIGVTTSQQMLQAELDVSRFSFMEEAGRLYAEKLLILLY